jgi:predicted nucleotide-binding protein (sugar kinase/HSP70/actin superfamily)
MTARRVLGDLFRQSPDWREFFQACCHTSALRLRSQARQFRNELRDRGHVVTREEVEDALFGMACKFVPGTPATDFTAWAELLCKDALARIQEHYTTLSADQKDAMDLTDAWRHNDAIDEACRNEDLSALREALKDYEREARTAIKVSKKESGAA